MYTQCPECNAVYRVSSAELSAAAGEVQCGACGARFDALDRLSDSFPGEPLPAGDEAEDHGPEPVDGQAAPENTAPAAGDQTEPVAEESEEAPSAETSGGDEEAEGEDRDVSRAAATDGSEEDDEPTVDLDLTAEEIFSLEELPDQQLPPVDELEFVEGLPSTAIEQEVIEPPPTELLKKTPSLLRPGLRRLLGLAIVAGLLALVIHSQHGLLMRNAWLAPILRGAYGVFGVEAHPQWDLGAYRIIESSAAVDTAGDLRVSLSFANEADFAQPYPLVRVSLEDRWGDEIGSLNLTPEEYLKDPANDRLLGPGGRTQGQATVGGPDRNAVGFRLDLCLPESGDRLRCLSNEP